jgi:hypothetical protein
MTHKEQVALNNLNASMKDIADILATAYEKFNAAYYDALAELGHSESMHEYNLSFQNFMNETNNTTFTETDFPDCNEEAYDDCEDLKAQDNEYTQDDADADKGDNESYPEQI